MTTMIRSSIDGKKPIKAGFHMGWMKLDPKSKWIPEIKIALQYYFDKYGGVPSFMFMNKNDIKVLNGAAGVTFMGVNIPIKGKQNTLRDHIELHP